MAWRWSVCGTAEVGWKPRFIWQRPSAHLHFLVSCFSFSSWQYPIYSLGFRSGEFAGQSSTPRPWSFNQLLVLLAVWAGATSCLKMKSACLKSMSAEGSMKCSKHSWWMGAVTLVFKKTQWTNASRWHWTPNHHRLWKLNAGLWATWAMSFSTLPPDSKTLVYKLNTKDTADDNCSQISWHVCVWWLLMPWPQPQSSPCEVHPNSWIDFTWQSS